MSEKIYMLLNRALLHPFRPSQDFPGIEAVYMPFLLEISARQSKLRWISSKRRDFTQKHHGQHLLPQYSSSLQRSAQLGPKNCAQNLLNHRGGHIGDQLMG
jgi:hypothetical protein